MIWTLLLMIASAAAVLGLLAFLSYALLHAWVLLCAWTANKTQDPKRQKLKD